MKKQQQPSDIYYGHHSVPTSNYMRTEKYSMKYKSIPQNLYYIAQLQMIHQILYGIEFSFIQHNSLRGDLNNACKFSNY